MDPSVDVAEPTATALREGMAATGAVPRVVLLPIEDHVKLQHFQPPDP